MVEPISLTGLTWSDPRGYDPVVAAAKAYGSDHPGFFLTWEKQSLQGFESAPIDELAARYDLMVIDHPHVGAVAGEGSLLALDTVLDRHALAELANQSVGRSFQSYFLDGHQWALPIDAATQVQARRPDLTAPAKRWSDVIALAEEGAVIWSLRSPHGLMNFFSLAANLGRPCRVSPGDLVELATGRRVFEAMAALARHMDEAFYRLDPIAVLDEMASGGRYRLAPLIYLYKGYANEGYRPHRIAFTDIAPLGENGPIGSTLGGTGIAVSAKTKHPKACADFALWLAGEECQTELYVNANGQPGNALAWCDRAVNEAVQDAYRDTRLTIETAWLRPRHKGYVAFQEEGAEIVADALRRRIGSDEAVARLNERFRASFAA